MDENGQTIDWDFVGEATEGLSGNDLANLAQEVLFLPVRELQATTQWKFSSDGSKVESAMDTTTDDPLVVKMKIDRVPSRMTPCPRTVNQADFVTALRSVKRTVTDDLMQKCLQFMEASGICG